MAFLKFQRNPRGIFNIHKYILNFGSLLISFESKLVGTFHSSSDFHDRIPNWHRCNLKFAEKNGDKAPFGHRSYLIIPTDFLSFPCASRHFSSATVITHNCKEDALAERLENALEARRGQDAWLIFDRLIKLRGFPNKTILNRLITVLAYSGNSKWMRKAHSLVCRVIHERKIHLLSRDSLFQLCLSLARAQMPLQASMILRTMAEKHGFPSLSVWKTIIGHMVKSENGTYLASEILIELCSLLQDAKHRNKRPAMKLDATIFCIVLNACVEFGSIRKAKEISELIPQIGVKVDATCFIIMAQIYEKNGCREEMKKLKKIIGEDPSMLDLQCQQFYSSLLKCHLNFGDLDAASKLVLDMLRTARVAKGDALCKQSEVPIALDDSHKQHEHPMVQTEPGNVQNNYVLQVPRYEYLVIYEKKTLSPNAKFYAMLAKEYLLAGRSDELTQFLIRLDKELGLALTENSTCTQVIDACIELGWLDYAHDMIDGMNSAGARVFVGLCSSLLKAYCNARRPMGIAPLLKVVRKAGLQLDPSCFEAMVEACVAEKVLLDAQDLIGEVRETEDLSLTNNDITLKMDLAKSNLLNLKSFMIEEVNKNQQLIPSAYELNSVIQFFCKRNLIDDAEKAFKKMVISGPQPNPQTFEYLVNGLFAEGKIQKLACLWEDIKRMEYDSEQSNTNIIKFDKELCDTFLYSFLRARYFDRCLEVITLMEQKHMFVDKWKYKHIFLKCHKDLHKHRKPSSIQTEDQAKTIKHVLAFKRWVGLI